MYWQKKLTGTRNDWALVISHEIRPLATLYPSYKKKVLYRAPLSVVAGGDMLIPTAFALLSFVSVKKYS